MNGIWLLGVLAILALLVYLTITALEGDHDHR